jgi:hypothetical protein
VICATCAKEKAGKITTELTIGMCIDSILFDDDRMQVIMRWAPTCVYCGHTERLQDLRS